MSTYIETGRKLGMQEQWNPVLASAARGFMHRADPNDPAISHPSADVAGAQRMISRRISSGSDSYDSEEELEDSLDRPEAWDDEGAAVAYELDFHACGVLLDVDSSIVVGVWSKLSKNHVSLVSLELGIRQFRPPKTRIPVYGHPYAARDTSI